MVTSSQGPFFSLASGSPNPKPTTACNTSQLPATFNKYPLLVWVCFILRFEP